jgi:hypothetical protein
MADDISVQLTADIDGLVSGMNDAADKVGDTMDKISESAQAAGEKLDSGISAGADKAAARVTSLSESSESLGSVFEDLHSKITTAFEAGGVMVAYEAIKKVGDALEEAMDHATEIENMSTVLGVSTDQFQALELAAAQAGVSMGKLDIMAVRLKEDLDKAHDGSKEATDQLFSLGISLAQIQDPAFDVGSALTLVADRLRDASTETVTMAAITTDFGARSAEVAIALKNFHGSADELAAVMKSVQAPTQQETGYMHELHSEFATASKWAGNLVDKVMMVGAATARAALDYETLGKFSEKFAGAAEAAATASMKMADASTVAASVQTDAINKVNAEQVESTHEVLELTKSGTFAKVQAEIDYVEAVKTKYGELSPEYKKALTEEAKAQQEFNEKAADDALKFSELQREAAEKLYEANREAARKAYSAMMKDATDYFGTLTKEQVDAAEGTEKVAVAQLESAEKILDSQHKLNEISPSTYLTAEIVVINERRDAEIKMYQDIAAARAGDKDAAVKAQDDIAAANAKADEQIVAANVKAVDATAAAWAKMDKSIESSFDSALDGMLKGTETFQQAAKKTFDTLAMDVINGAVNKMLEGWLKMAAQQVASSEEATSVMKALGLSNLVTAKATSAVQSTGQITDSAAVGAAAAVASTAAIPYVGPELAPAAAAETDASIMAFAAQLSAAQGGILDKDALVGAHAEEMILPPHISKGIQEALGSGRFNQGEAMHTGIAKGIQEAFGAHAQGATAGGGGGSSDTHHYHISSTDAASFEKLLSKQSSRNALMKNFNKSLMRGNRGISGMGNRGVR